MFALRHPVFVVAVLLFTGNQILEKSGRYIPYIHAWLDDFLCMPVVLTFALVFMRRATKKGDKYVLSPLQVTFAVVYISAVFELLLPLFAKRFHSDPLDVVAYVAGAVLFYFTVNRRTSSR